MTTKSNIKMFLDNLSITDKVDILKELYKDISGLGVDGDTQLAHINSFEADLLRSVGGAGTLHMTTGLPQYKGGGGGAPSSVYQQQNQSSRLSEEAAPFAKDVLTEAQDYYRGILNQGYDPYTGAITAPMTQEQIDAQEGIKGLAGTGTALQREGLDLYRQQGERFTPEIAAEYQSPYQQAVTDVEKRKAVEDFERNIMPQFESQAVQAGGMSGLGSRAGVQAGILGENLQTRLGDIQARGLQSSYMDAQKLFQDQKRREQAQAGAVAQLGPASFGQGLAEQGAIQTVGEQRQALAQSALDEQYYKYLEQKAFPEEQLAKYSGFVYGNPLLSERDVSSTASAPGAQGPSFGSQLLGTGLAAANTFRQVAPQTFGAVRSGIGFGGRKHGGGLSDIVYRQDAGQTSTDTDKRTLIDDLTQKDKVPSFPRSIREIESAVGDAVGDSGVLESILKTGIQTLTPIYNAAGDLIRYTTGIDSPSMEEWTGVKPYNLKKDMENIGDRITGRDKPSAPKGVVASGSVIGEDDYADATANIIADAKREKEFAAKRALAEKAAKKERLAKYDLGTVEGIEASAAEQSRILNAAADMNKRIRVDARGEVDRTGIIFQALSASLLKSVTGDPRDPASTRGTFLLRIADGLKDGSVSIAEAEKEMKKLERVDAELEIKDKKEVTKIKQGKIASLGGLPAKLKALAMKQAAARGLSEKQASEIIKNNLAAYKNAAEALTKIQEDGGDAMVDAAYVAAQSALGNAAKGTKAEAIKDFVNNLGDDEKEILAARAYQKQIDAIFSGKPVDIREAVLRAAQEMARSGMEASQTWIPFQNKPSAQFPDPKKNG